MVKVGTTQVSIFDNYGVEGVGGANDFFAV